MPRIAKDLTGQVFGRLKVIVRDGSKRGAALWECQCLCGNKVVIVGNELSRGNVKSCGCFRSERMKSRNLRHGKSGSRVYSIWQGMKKRCNYPSTNNYQDYGGRGIKVCPRWEDFENFLEDMGEPPSRASLERINNDKDYEPGNCRWATIKEQQNNRRSNVLLTHQGKTQTIKEWADEYEIDYQLFWRRITKLEWPVEKALTQKSRQK